MSLNSAFGGEKLILLIVCAWVAMSTSLGWTNSLSADDDERRKKSGELFMRKVRPIFVEHCIECHTGQRPESMFDLSSRKGVLKGGELLGPALDVDQPLKSILLHVVKDEDEVAMPPAGQLDKKEIEAIEEWLRLGGVWPKGVELKSR